MSKRFTDEELAAEWWRASGDMSVLDAGYDIDGWSSDLAEADNRQDTINRFSTHPHHDQEGK